MDRKIKIFFSKFDFIRKGKMNSEVINWVKSFDELFLKNKNFVLDEWRETNQIMYVNNV